MKRFPIQLTVPIIVLISFAASILCAPSKSFISVQQANAQGSELEAGRKLYEQGLYSESLATFRACLMRNPNDWQAWYYVGASEFRLRKYEEAVDSFNKYFLLSEPNSRDQGAAYYFLGFCNYEMGRFPEALESIEKHFGVYKHLSKTPDPTAYALLGRCRSIAGKYEEAIDPLKKAALKSDPNSSNYYYLGYAQLKAGKRDDALASLKMGLKVNEKDEQIAALLREEFPGELKAKSTDKAPGEKANATE